MTAPAMCPHCGWNFATDDSITAGRWTLTPGGAWIGDRKLRLSPTQAGILYAVAKAAGAPVRREALVNRLCQTENVNSISVQVSRIHDKLGDDFPLRTEKGRGYLWDGN